MKHISYIYIHNLFPFNFWIFWWSFGLLQGSPCCFTIIVACLSGLSLLGQEVAPEAKVEADQDRQLERISDRIIESIAVLWFYD